MADVKYTAVPVSDPEKVDPNAPEKEPQQPACASRRSWCRRWCANRDGEENPRQRRFRIFRRILLTLVLFYFIRQVLHAQFEQWRMRNDESAFPNQFFMDVEQYHPEFEDVEFYGTELSEQDPVAQELYDEFFYLFNSPESLFGHHSDEDLFENDEPMSEFDQIDSETSVDTPQTMAQDLEVDEDLEVEKHKKHRKNPKHPICKDSDLRRWDGPSEFSFTPSEFSSVAVVLDGMVSGRATVSVYQRDDNDLSDYIKVKVHIRVGSEKIGDDINVSAYDYNGTYVVEIDTPKHVPNKPDNNKKCVKVHVEVSFPAGIDTFGDLNLRFSKAIIKAQDLDGIYFDNVRAGVGKGGIFLKNVNADNFRVGAVRGAICGDVHVGSNITTGTINGHSKLLVTPAAGTLYVKSSAVQGNVDVNIPADTYEGRFVLAALFGSLALSAPNPADLHVEKVRPNFKAGYYKADTESLILLSVRHGKVGLSFI